MQRNDPAGAVELPSVTAETTLNAPELDIIQQDPNVPNLQAAATAEPPQLALTLNSDQEDAQQLRHTFFFNLLPQDVQEKLVDYGVERPLLHLSLFPQMLDLKVATNQAVLAALQGDLPKVQVLAQQRPALLIRKGTASDYSRRAFSNITPLQAALCAWDDAMFDMLKEYMHPEEVKRQYAEIFPNGHAAHCAAQKPYDFSALVDVITRSPAEAIEAALKKQQNDSPLCQTLQAFRVNFTALAQQEKIFNPQHFIKACEVYNERYSGWNGDQCDLFWRQVIGYVQRFLPANLAQDVAQGLYYRVSDNEPAQRSFNFRACGGAILPLEFGTHSGLGFDYGTCSGMVSAGAGAGALRPGWRLLALGGLFYDLMSNKSRALGDSLSHPHRTELPRVVGGLDSVK